MPFLWQLAQAVVAWAPASGKTEAWFVNVPCCHVVSENLWQVSHVVGKPDETCDGFLEFWKSVMWQAEQGLVGTVV